MNKNECMSEQLVPIIDELICDGILTYDLASHKTNVEILTPTGYEPMTVFDEQALTGILMPDGSAIVSFKDTEQKNISSIILH